MTVLAQPVPRLEGNDKVRGSALYAFEHRPEGILYAWPVQSRIAVGRIISIAVENALAMPGVVEILTSTNAPHLHAAGDGELLVLQSDEVAYRGQVVALVIAETLEDARETARVLDVSYAESSSADARLVIDHPKLYAPESVNGGFATDSETGDVDAAIAEAAVSIDRTYTTPALFNNPMEPHSSIAHWTDDGLDVIDSSQGTSGVRDTLATLFDLEPDTIRVRAEHVGGAFGSKGSARPNVVLAVMAAKLTGRPVKIAYTRQMMFSLAGYRSPTMSRLRLASDAEGKLTAISHQAFSQTSTIEEFTEQSAESTRHMYAAANRLTTHRVAALDVPTPRWMRAPGECPGMYALESAMDELATAARIDPVALRLRNEPDKDPETGQMFSSRNLVGCLERGAELFGWSARDPRPAARREGRWLVGTGVACSTYPVLVMPSSARITARHDGRFDVEVNATDIGTGARTVTAQVAADALGVGLDAIDIHIGDSDLPTASVAGGSSGTSSWGWAVTKAGRELRASIEAGKPIPSDGLTVETSTAEEIDAMEDYSRFAYGAQFVEARVDLDSGEIVVPRMLGIFSAGRILNARTARSQLIGGMTMGLSMALHEDGVLDQVNGDFANHDFAGYHVATAADIDEIKVEWLAEDDSHLAPMAGKGIGEIGIVGTAAAVANAVWHATGVRVRDLPIQPDKLFGSLPWRF